MPRVLRNLIQCGACALLLLGLLLGTGCARSAQARNARSYRLTQAFLEEYARQAAPIEQRMQGRGEDLPFGVLRMREGLDSLGYTPEDLELACSTRAYFFMLLGNLGQELRGELEKDLQDAQRAGSGGGEQARDAQLLIELLEKLVGKYGPKVRDLARQPFLFLPGSDAVVLGEGQCLAANIPGLSVCSVLAAGDSQPRLIHNIKEQPAPSPGELGGAALSPDGAFLVAVDTVAKRLRCWDTRSGALRWNSDPIQDLIPDPDGGPRFVQDGRILVSRTGQCYSWLDAASGKTVRTVDLGTANSDFFVAWEGFLSPSGRFVLLRKKLFGGKSWEMVFYDAEGRQLKACPFPAGDDVSAYASFTVSGDSIFKFPRRPGFANFLARFDEGKGGWVEIPATDVYRDATQLLFAPDGKRFAYLLEPEGSEDRHNLVLASTADTRTLRVVACPRQVDAMMFTHGGNILAYTLKGSALVRFLDVASGEPVNLKQLFLLEGSGRGR